ncbi:MAG TPA: prolyl oligopeptidase family serine peptidase [Thermoguttaceae bacterium]
MKLLSEQKAYNLFFIYVFCVSLLSSGSVFSQVNKLDGKNLEETMRNPWKPDQERSAFLQDWLILGSIPIDAIEEIDKDFLAENNGEANVQPIEGQVVKISGSEMKWTPVKCNDAVDLLKIFQGGRTQNALAYAYTKINRKKAGRTYIAFGSDDGIKVWLNGKLVHRVAKTRPLVLDEDGVALDMNAGENHLLLKIQQSGGGWGFAARIMENMNVLDFATGNIEFSLTDINPQKNTLTVQSTGNLDQLSLKQTVQMEVYAAGGNTIVKKTFDCSQSVVLNYENWPDGAYEFRFTYKDIRGATSIKYASWYKGDILAAARQIVESAPDKDIKTPEAATHRMLADMIMDRLGKNLQNPDPTKLGALDSPLMEFAEIKSNKQIYPGGFVRLAYIDDIDDTPQFCRCYLPLKCDPSKKLPMIVSLHGYNGEFPEYIHWWSVDKRHDLVSDTYDVIYIEPHGRGNADYLGIGDRDVLKCIEMAKQKFNVDDNRVYLMGFSMGGFGTWNVATRHPELFAAIAPVYGGDDYRVFLSPENIEKMSAWERFLNEKSVSTAQIESLLNMPILVSHGDQDQAVNVNLSRYLVRLLQRWNYDVRYIEVPGKGHSELGLWDQTVSWMLEHKRNSMPRHVRVRAANLRTASAYWVKVTQQYDPAEFMVVDAEALDGNILRIDSKNVCEMSLTPAESLIDFSKPIKVVWNGKAVPVDNLQARNIVLKAEDYKPASLKKTPRLAGPISDYTNTPFMIVVGTISNNSMTNKIIEQKAGIMIHLWKRVQKYEPRVKKDVEVTEEDLNKYSLILLGGPEDNKISKLVFEKIPFQVKSDEIIIDGRSFKVNDAVLEAVYPNPYNAERYVVVVVGTSATGMAFFDPRRTSLFESDFYIADRIVPKAGVKNEKTMVASGFFNYNWKIDDALVNVGDENVRSKCPYMVVNNDLSTKVVGFAKPSLELMKSYVGTYPTAADNQIIISYENDKLIGFQTYTERPVVLQPISEKEFYFSEVNGTVSFEKDGPTDDYTLTIGYQNGQEFTAEKLK